MIKRADLTTDENIRMEADSIHITNSFIEMVKKSIEIYKDAIANVDSGPLQCHAARTIDRVFQRILATLESER